MTEDLKQLFEHHVWYEVWMLVETHKRLEGQVSDVVVANALIESFCIHARALNAFFHDRKGAAASTFTKASYVPFSNGSIADDLVTKLSTQIAHLTPRRVSDPAGKIDREARRELFVKSPARRITSYNI